MVEERLASKKERIADMEKTKADIERQIKSAQDRDEKRQRMETAKETAKSEIAAITVKGPKGGGENLSRSANVPATQSVMDALSNVLGETFEDVADTVKAVTSVMADKAEEAIEKAKDIAEEVVEIVTKERDEIVEAAAEKAEEVKETAAEVAEKIEEKVEDVVENVKDAVADATDAEDKKEEDKEEAAS